MIVSSFLTQYGLRLRTKDFQSVSWDEFRSILAGLAPETPLGRVVAIRSETDKDVLKGFTREQKRIHDEWKKQRAAAMTPEMYEREMQSLKDMLRRYCS